MNSHIQAAIIIALAFLGYAVLDNVLYRLMDPDTTCASSVGFHQLQQPLVQQVEQLDHELLYLPIVPFDEKMVSSF